MNQPAIENGDLVVLHCPTGGYYGHVWFYGAGEHPLATQSVSIIELVPTELRLPSLEGAAKNPLQRPAGPMLLTTQVLLQILLYMKAPKTEVVLQ